MWYSERLLGSTTTRALAERAGTHVLVLGTDRFTRGDLARVGCFNYLAAATLTRIVARDLSVKGVQHLFDTTTPADFVLPSIGPIALAVLGAAFELAGVGGDSPLEAWVRAHRSKGAADDFVTFHTMKAQEARREAAEKADRKRRDTRAGNRRIGRRSPPRGTTPQHPRG